MTGACSTGTYINRRPENVQTVIILDFMWLYCSPIMSRQRRQSMYEAVFDRYQTGGGNQTAC